MPRKRAWGPVAMVMVAAVMTSCSSSPGSKVLTVGSYHGLTAGYVARRRSR
jgi:hypothetical protein